MRRIKNKEGVLDLQNINIYSRASIIKNQCCPGTEIDQPPPKKIEERERIQSPNQKCKDSGVYFE